jgi:para-nitrobenzyl esterase
MPRGLSGFSPNLDNWVITSHAPAHEVPLIDGMVANDIGIADFGDGRSRAPVTMEVYNAQMKNVCGHQVASCLKLYPATDQKEAGLALEAARRDRARVSIYLWAADQVKRGPVYTYYFDHAEPWPQYPLFGAFHTSEVPYVFQTISVLRRAWQPEDFKISREMSSYWTNFAKRGDPNGSSVPQWPKFTVDSKTTMELGSRMGAMPLAEPARLKFFLHYLRTDQKKESSHLLEGGSHAHAL